jgi:dephospho-CoA kinase
VEARIDAQLSNQARSARADVVIDNNGDEATLLAQLDAHWRRLAAAVPTRAHA